MFPIDDVPLVEIEHGCHWRCGGSFRGQSSVWSFTKNERWLDTFGAMVSPFSKSSVFTCPHGNIRAEFSKVSTHLQEYAFSSPGFSLESSIIRRQGPRCRKRLEERPLICPFCSHYGAETMNLQVMELCSLTSILSSYSGKTPKGAWPCKTARKFQQ